jgi:hypothetical protein
MFKCTLDSPPPFKLLEASKIPLHDKEAFVENAQEQLKTALKKKTGTRRKWDAVLWQNPRYF